MSEILNYTSLPETTHFSEMNVLVGEPTNHPEPAELSAAGGAILIGTGIILTGVLVWMNSHKDRLYRKYVDREQDDNVHQR